jgi:hypothetical protein
MNGIEQVIAACPHALHACQRIKAYEIDKAIQTGIPYTALGGKRMRCKQHLLRFKVGAGLRLIYQSTENGASPLALITRQRLERELKRRRSIQTANVNTYKVSKKP